MAYSNSRRSVPTRKRNKSNYDRGTTFSVPSIACDALTVGGETVPAARVCYQARYSGNALSTPNNLPRILEWNSEPTNIGGVVLQNVTDVVLPLAGCYVISVNASAGNTLSDGRWFVFFTVDGADPHYAQNQGNMDNGVFWLTGTATVLCNAGSVVQAYVQTGDPAQSPETPNDPTVPNILTIVKI